jgi:hypothetical protein
MFNKSRLISLANDHYGNTYSFGKNSIIQQRDANLQNLKGGSYSVNKTEAAIATLGDPIVTQGFDRLFEAMGGFEYYIETTNKELKDFLDQQILDTNWSILFEGLGLAKLTGLAALEPIWGLQGGQIVIEDLLPIDSRRIVYSYTNNSYAYQPRFTTLSQPFEGEQLPENKVIIHKYFSAFIDNPYGLGIGSLLIEIISIKQQLIDIWLKISNNHAIPIKIANIPSAASEEDVNNFFDCLKAMNNSSTFVLPEGYTLDVKDMSATGLDKIILPLINYCDESILGLIIGESITGKELANGSNAKDLVAKDITNAKALSLAKDICSTLNKTLINWLTAYNYPGQSVKITVKSTENLAESLQMYKDLKDLGLIISPEWLSEKFSVPHIPRKKLGDSV